MKNGIPVAYATYRTIWQVLHIALILAVLVAFSAWFVHDSQGAQAVTTVADAISSTQRSVANAISFPWGN